MKLLRNVLLVISAVSPFMADAQKNSTGDTIHIKEIVIEAKITDGITGSWKQIEIDSGLLSGKKLLSLSDIMTESVPLYIKTYGPGNLSTVSFRGTGAVHTQVAWNGIVINSPMLGQIDLSIIPSAFADEITIDCGSSSMFRTNGAFGGLINLKTKPEWNNGLRAGFDFGTGSFGLWSGSLKAEAGNNRFQSVTRLFYRRADNDFRYLNNVSYSEPVYERRLNADFSQYAVMNEIFFRGINSVSSLSVWAQAAARNLPPNILLTATAPGESQNDASVRTIFSHSKYYSKSNLDLTSAVIYDKLNYTNKQAMINSLNQSVSFINKGAWETRFQSGLNVKLALNEEFNIVKSVNYNGLKQRNILSVTGIARKKIQNGGITLLVGEIISGKKLLLPDFSAGFDYYIEGKIGKFIKANLSRNSRIPTMNDLYWNPGGNPDIRNEYCFSGEINGGINHQIDKNFVVSGEASLYSHRIRDMIQWLPGDNNYWRPENILSVNVTGCETNFKMNYSTENLKYFIHIHYTLNKSVYGTSSEQMKGKQLLYVPFSQGGGNIKVQYNKTYASLNGEYTGKRFTTVDNSKFLRGYFIVNSEIGTNLQFLKSNFGLKIRVENILNTEYEMIAYYPMPGRWFMFSVNYRYGK